MWPFAKRFKPHPEVKETVQYAEQYALKYLEHKGLLSLYLAGSILTEDKTAHSDIDLFGIVDKNFDPEEETKLNDDFKSQESTLLQHIPTTFRAIPLSALKGGEQWGSIVHFTPQRFVKRLSFFDHVWGKDFKAEDVSLPPLTLKQEALLLMDQLEESITQLRAGKEAFPFKDFPKHVMELARVEAQQKGFTFHPSYKKLAKFFKKQKNHVVHQAYYLHCQDTIDRVDVLVLCAEAERYAKKFMQEISGG